MIKRCLLAVDLDPLTRAINNSEMIDQLYSFYLYQRDHL